jgi:hypothetical protein
VLVVSRVVELGDDEVAGERPGIRFGDQLVPVERRIGKVFLQIFPNENVFRCPLS